MLAETPAPNGGAKDALVKDTTTNSFRQDVIAESMHQPVLVDFWAPWCGPCKQLTPIIEKVVTEAGGRVKLVKMNIDDHPSIAGQLGIQSIPAVVAFIDGRPADGFMGAVPESQIRAFIEKIAVPPIIMLRRDRPRSPRRSASRRCPSRAGRARRTARSRSVRRSSWRR